MFRLVYQNNTVNLSQTYYTYFLEQLHTFGFRNNYIKAVKKYFSTIIEHILLHKIIVFTIMKLQRDINHTRKQTLWSLHNICS